MPYHLMPMSDNLELESIIKEWFDALKPKQQVVVLHRYGLGGHDIKTLEEISNELSLTRERVRQIQNETLISFKTTSYQIRL